MKEWVWLCSSKGLLIKKGLDPCSRGARRGERLALACKVEEAYKEKMGEGTEVKVVHIRKTMLKEE